MLTLLMRREVSEWKMSRNGGLVRIGEEQSRGRRIRR